MYKSISISNKCKWAILLFVFKIIAHVFDLVESTIWTVVFFPNHFIYSWFFFYRKYLLRNYTVDAIIWMIRDANKLWSQKKRITHKKKHEKEKGNGKIQWMICKIHVFMWNYDSFTLNIYIILCMLLHWKMASNKAL